MNAYLESMTAYWSSGGPLLVPLGMVCFAIWAYFLRSRRRLLAAIREADALEEGLRENPAPADLAADGSGCGVRAAAVRAIGAVLEGDKPAAAFEREEEEETSRLRRDIVVLAALTTIAPLLGLLGTVMGMIETFQAVSATGGESGIRVASGVSKALITTQFGLVVAIPGVFGVARLSRLADHVQVRWAMLRVRLTLRLEAAGFAGANV